VSDAEKLTPPFDRVQLLGRIRAVKNGKTTRLERALIAERDQLSRQLAVFDGDPASFITCYKDLESENERLREALLSLHSRFGHRESCDCSTCLDVRAVLAEADRT
jgi:hypothetical protein